MSPLLGLPANPAAIYWESYYGNQTRIINLSQAYNIIFLFQALPSGSTGSVVFQRGGTTATLNADIATCRARGQRVIMTCGGQGAQITINSQATADNFINSIKAENVLLGGSGTTAAFDGIDWNNFEGSQAGTASPAWMTYCGVQLKAYYGSDFLVTAPPAPEYTSGPGSASAQVVSDRLLLATMYQGGALDWFCPQNYDNAESYGEVIFTRQKYQEEVTVNGQPVTLPSSVIGIGFRVGGAGQWATNSAAATAFTDAVTAGYAPKGGFVFSANNNATNGSGFATTVIPVMTNYTDPPVSTPAFSLVASSNFTNGAATTAQLTPPAGKTTVSDFQAGSINETSNPAASLNLASGKYTELEWNIRATADAVNAQQYEFRVTYNGVSLDTYSVTPKWTIGTAPPPPDTTAPTVPTNLVATAVSTTQINLTWTASTDAVGVTGYRVYRGGVFVGSIAASPYLDSGLTPSTSYTYTVSAVDLATNESAQSSSDTESTQSVPVGDTTAPAVTLTAPTALEIISGTSVTFSADATDAVGVVGVQFTLDGIDIGAEDTTPSGSSYSITFDTTTKPNGVYSFAAFARDAAGNVGTASSTLRILNVENPPEPEEGPKSATGTASMTGIASITL